MPKIKQNFVVVTNRSYGKALKDKRIYYEGKRPKSLKPDGRIVFGKHILEAVRRVLGDRARWIITDNVDSITTEYGVVRVRTSQRLLGKMSSENFARTADIKNNIVQRFFSTHFPSHFSDPVGNVYVPGSLARLVSKSIVPRLTSEDKKALNDFLPDYIAAESIGSVRTLQATTQIHTLRQLADNLVAEMARPHPESWWQSYIKTNIFLMQQGYIKALDKMNVAVGDQKFPDFCMVTHDNYLDILEIKKPNTSLLKHDGSRDNFYWDSEMAKAISQTENYIEQVASKAAEVRSYLLDKEKLDIKVIRPRGIILCGDARSFGSPKERADFRLLSQGIKSITVLTYDELFTRLSNYIQVLEQFSKPDPTTRRTRKKRAVK
jgi:Domain of unknown function (DUF4263)